MESADNFYKGPGVTMSAFVLEAAKSCQSVIRILRD